MTLAVGTEVEERLFLGEAEVRRFGEAVGDLNPIHFDRAHAAASRFGRPIVHGTFLLGILGKMMGMRLPGPGTIYLEHTVRFRKAVPVGSTVLFRVQVLESRPRDRYLLRTDVLDEGGEACVQGEALVWHPPSAMASAM